MRDKRHLPATAIGRPTRSLCQQIVAHKIQQPATGSRAGLGLPPHHTQAS